MNLTHLMNFGKGNKMISMKPTTLKNVDVFRDGELLMQGISLHSAKDSYEYDEIITSTTQNQLDVTNNLLVEAVNLLRDASKGSPEQQKMIIFLNKFDK